MSIGQKQAKATVDAAFASPDQLQLDVEAAFRSAESCVLRALFGVTPDYALFSPGDRVSVDIKVSFAVLRKSHGKGIT